MGHLAGRCSCGRKVHFPKHATLGHPWTCYHCGKAWNLSTRGKPLHRQRSRLPKLRNRQAVGCLVMLVPGIAMFAGLLYWALA